MITELLNKSLIASLGKETNVLVLLVARSVRALILFKSSLDKVMIAVIPSPDLNADPPVKLYSVPSSFLSLCNCI